MEEFGELKDFDFVGFDELFFVFENGLLKSLIHGGSSWLDLMHEGWDVRCVWDGIGIWREMRLGLHYDWWFDRVLLEMNIESDKM